MEKGGVGPLGWALQGKVVSGQLGWGTAAGEQGGPGGDAGHKALGRTPYPEQPLSASPQSSEALLCPRVKGGGGLIFCPCPSPWLILAAQEGGQSHQSHWPWAWHPSPSLHDRAEGDTWETRSLQKFFAF